MRAQTSLPALAVALLLVTAAVVIGVTAADSALRDADRQALDRQAAVGLADRLVRADASVTARANVVNESAISALSVSDLRRQYGLAPGASVRITLADRPLVTSGNPSGGVTIERLVLVQRRETRTLTPRFDATRTVTLPRRTPTVTLTVDPPANTTVRSVFVDGRVRLHNDSGLDGRFELPLSTVETASIRFDATGPLTAGSVRIDYRPARTEKARLEVTVDG